MAAARQSWKTLQPQLDPRKAGFHRRDRHGHQHGAPARALPARALRKRQLVAAQAARVAILDCQFHGSSSLSRLIG